MATSKDPLRALRSLVAKQQGLSTRKKPDDQSVIQHLLGNIDWAKLVPIVMPLIMQVLRKKQSAAPSSQAGSAGSPDILGGLLGTLMGGGGGTASPEQSPQAGLLGALLGGGGGTQPTGQSPQADLLGALLGGTGGTQSSGQSPQADLLGSLLGAAAGSMATRQPETPSQDGQPASPPAPQDAGTGLLGMILQATTTPQASQSGGLLGQLGAQPGSQRANGTNGLLDLLASATDLDSDGVPDALEGLLGGTIESDDQRKGGASLLEGVLGAASPDTLATFSKAAVKLLSNK